MVSPQQRAATLAATSILDGGQPFDYHDHYSTPPPVIDPLVDYFDFSYDLAACEDNHVVSNWLGPGGRLEDSLAVDWTSLYSLSKGRWLWLNPPFRREILVRFVHKAKMESNRGAAIVAILPAHRTEQPWWKECVVLQAQMVVNIRCRVAYELKGAALEAWRMEEAARAKIAGRLPAPKPMSPNFPSCLAIFDPRYKTGITELVTWNPRDGVGGIKEFMARFSYFKRLF